VSFLTRHYSGMRLTWRESLKSSSHTTTTEVLTPRLRAIHLRNSPVIPQPSKLTLKVTTGSRNATDLSNSHSWRNYEFETHALVRSITIQPLLPAVFIQKLVLLLSNSFSVYGAYCVELPLFDIRLLDNSTTIFPIHQSVYRHSHCLRIFHVFAGHFRSLI